MPASPSANFIAAAAFTLLAAASAAETAAGTGAAAAEVQYGLCGDTGQIIRALALRPRGPVLEVWQFDDAALSLFARGLRFRLRVAPAASELTLKAAVKECRDVPPHFVPAGAGKCEYDVYGPNVGSAVSLNHRLDQSFAEALIAGRRPVAEALNAPQERYLRDAAAAWPLPAGLQALGPMRVQKYRAAKGGYEVDVTEMPGGERYTEISRKVPVSSVEETRKALERDLASAGVAICADVSGQAKKKLEALLRRP